MGIGWVECASMDFSGMGSDLPMGIYQSVHSPSEYQKLYPVLDVASRTDGIPGDGSERDFRMGNLGPLFGYGVSGQYQHQTRDVPYTIPKTRKVVEKPTKFRIPVLSWLIESWSMVKKI